MSHHEEIKGKGMSIIRWMRCILECLYDKKDAEDVHIALNAMIDWLAYSKHTVRSEKRRKKHITVELYYMNLNLGYLVRI